MRTIDRFMEPETSYKPPTDYPPKKCATCGDLFERRKQDNPVKWKRLKNCLKCRKSNGRCRKFNCTKEYQ